ncbi:MAG: hypothetical protein ABGY21_13855, partial [Pseudomonadota bacterium]
MGSAAVFMAKPKRRISKADSFRGEELIFFLRYHLQTKDKRTRTALLDCLGRLDHILTALPEESLML